MGYIKLTLAGKRMATYGYGSLLFALLMVAAFISSAGGGTRACAFDPSCIGEEIRILVNYGILPGLRWPDFSDYRSQVQKFYETSGYSPAWCQAGRPTPQAQAMIDVFVHADRQGLNPDDYDASRWPARIAALSRSPATTDFARFDLAMTISVLRYVSDLHLGRLNPGHFHVKFDIPQDNSDLAHFVRENLVGSTDLAASLAQVEPPFDGYRRTENMLRVYLQLAREDDGEQLPIPNKPVRVGDHYAGLKRLQDLLCRLQDLPKDACLTFAAASYEQSLADGVRHFQHRHQLPENGNIDAATVAQLNVSLSQRVSQLQLTLERWRWLPHHFLQPPIVVNIPEFRLRALDQRNSISLAMNVVVGRAYRHQTPVFAKDMRFVIFRPYWNVPLSIQRGEIVPAILRDRNYITKKDYEVVSRTGQVVSDGAVSDEVLTKLQNGTLRIRQRPGPKNALGLVKFIFPNEFDVYLHGTPSMELFARPRRDFSHGCIRVEQPIELATWVLRNNPGWDRNRVITAMQLGRDNYEVDLVKPIPVLIVYGTAIVDETNEVHFFQDIYGHDAKLIEVLAKGYPYRRP